MTPYDFHPEAKAELIGASVFYELRREGLGVHSPLKLSVRSRSFARIPTSACPVAFGIDESPLWASPFRLSTGTISSLS